MIHSVTSIKDEYLELMIAKVELVKLNPTKYSLLLATREPVKATPQVSPVCSCPAYAVYALKTKTKTNKATNKNLSLLNKSFAWWPSVSINSLIFDIINLCESNTCMTWHMHDMACRWKPEDILWELVLFFDHVDPRGWIWVVGLSGKYLYSLNLLASSCLYILSMKE